MPGGPPRKGVRPAPTVDDVRRVAMVVPKSVARDHLGEESTRG
ncbi:MAG: hypothetical protein ACXWDI_10705 [Nocardioides sp.]